VLDASPASRPSPARLIARRAFGVNIMKITKEHQNTLRNLLEDNAKTFMHEDLKACKASFLAMVESGEIKILKCPAVNMFSRLATKKALFFICDELYDYMTDDHINTFYRALYKDL
jgi:hypothetical protein